LPVLNVLVRELAPLEQFLVGDEARASVHPLPAAEVGSNMRAVAPPIQSFATGRRR
jgi:hypothetical protein